MDEIKLSTMDHQHRLYALDSNRLVLSMHHIIVLEWKTATVSIGCYRTITGHHYKNEELYTHQTHGCRSWTRHLTKSAWPTPVIHCWYLYFNVQRFDNVQNP